MSGFDLSKFLAVLGISLLLDDIEDAIRLRSERIHHWHIGVILLIIAILLRVTKGE